jgi:hypothetical protein
MACGPSPALEPTVSTAGWVPSEPPPSASPPAPPPPAAKAEVPDFDVQIGGADDGNLTDERHPRTCELRTARLAEVQREIAVVEREHDQYVTDRCKPTLKWQHDRVWGTSNSPQRAWICNGKHVDTLKSPRLEYLLTREVNLRDYVRMNCR